MDSGRIARGPVTRAGLALLLVATALLLVVLGGCGSARAGASTTHGRAGASTTPVVGPAAASGARTVTITGAAVGHPVPDGFVGMSIEEKALEQFAGANPGALNPSFVHLLQDIAPQQSPVLRIGGDSTDWSWWPVAHMAQPAGVRYALTPTWMSVAHALAAELNARLILGIDLEADSGAVATAEAHVMLSRIGRQYIDALELGNEPELYGSFGWYRSHITGRLVPGRPRSYGFASFVGDFARFGGYLNGDPLAGPSMGGPRWLESLGVFIRNERRLNLVTIHAYPLKHCTKSTVVTSAQLLADSSSRGLAQRVLPWVAEAAGHHLPLRIDEMNGISCGGTRGVSDTFASALWVLDTLFEMARVGVDGVNVHTVPGTINEVLGPEQVSGHWAMRVHPEFYGMVMFADAAPAGARLLHIAAKFPAGVKVWGTRAPNGTLHVVVINKRLAGAPVALRLRLPSAQGAATAVALRARSVRAASGVTLGGQTFGTATSTGLLQGPASSSAVAPAGDGSYSVRVPSLSAEMLTVSGS